MGTTLTKLDATCGGEEVAPPTLKSCASGSAGASPSGMSLSSVSRALAATVRHSGSGTSWLTFSSPGSSRGKNTAASFGFSTSCARQVADNFSNQSRNLVCALS